MESSMTSSQLEAFPVGLRILVVDDDLTWLKILEKMLKKCAYEVTTCCLASVALELLHERRERFDIVISDVNMPDMDGFELLEHVGLKMDLPVIMMSVDGETSRVMKGVQHGACDYLLKPIRMKELRNIWQHVYRKRIHEIKEIEGFDISEEVQILRNAAADFDDRQLFCGAEFNALRKRKDMDSKEASDQELSDASSVKKARVVWSVDLHQKFVNAVNQIGFDKVGPKKILDLMSVPGLRRENIASHLQKYRLYLSRLQKKNKGKGSDKNTQTEFSPKEPQGSFGIQNSPRIHQNTEASKYVPITQNNYNDPTEAITTEKDKTGLTQMKSDFTYYRSRHSSITISPVSCTIDSVSEDFGTSKKNGTDLASMSEDLQLCSLQNPPGCFEHVGLNGMDFFQYNYSTPLTEFGTNWYDSLEVNCEYLCDSVDYPILDDCLFV